MAEPSSDDIQEREVPEVNVLDLPDDQIADITFEDLGQTGAEESSDDVEGLNDEAIPENTVVETDGDPIADLSYDPDDAESPVEESDDGESAEDDADDQQETTNYEDQLKSLMAPFKANGKDMQVDSVEDARQLMQMGANYNKKMAGLKPNLKLLKMLENNELLDESKLSFLIDVQNKNPDAIKKLLKESGIDPLDVDLEAQTDYTPKTYTVSDSEVDLDNVLADLKDTPTYHDTMDIISNKWDDASKQVLVGSPDIIRAINAQVAAGTYEQITKVMETERMLGRLDGLSDIAAYKQIGDMLFQAGKLVGAQPQQESKPEIKAPNVSKQANDPKLKARKLAAAGTKAKPASKAPAAFNPLALSDDEFEKAARPF